MKSFFIPGLYTTGTRAESTWKLKGFAFCFHACLVLKAFPLAVPAPASLQWDRPRVPWAPFTWLHRGAPQVATPRINQ